MLSLAPLFAQTPEKKNRALLYKITATWCYPCGTWGWDLVDEMVDHLGDEAIYLALFNSSQKGYDNTAFYNATAVTLGFNFRHSGWPSFGVNGINMTNQNTGSSGTDVVGIRDDCYDAVAAFNEQPVVVNAASSISISDSVLQVDTEVLFFDDAEGDYYVGTYIVEDGALNYQFGHTGKVAHKGVLRAAIDSLDWGSLIASGDIEAGYTASKSYTYQLAGKNWDPSKLVIYNIIWKKEGTKHYYVNGSKHQQGVASSKTYSQEMLRLQVYPNPASGLLTVVSDQDKTVNIIFRSIIGNKVMDTPIQPGTNHIDINALAQGVYLIEAEGSGGGFQKLVVQ